MMCIILQQSQADWDKLYQPIDEFHPKEPKSVKEGAKIILQFGWTKVAALRNLFKS